MSSWKLLKINVLILCYLVLDLLGWVLPFISRIATIAIILLSFSLMLLSALWVLEVNGIFSTTDIMDRVYRNE